MTRDSLIAQFGAVFAALATLSPVLVGLPALYGRFVQTLLRRKLRRLRAGDAGPLFAACADDIRFVFPGKNSWTANLRGRDEVARWLMRFVGVGLRLEAHEILVAGSLWNTTACVRCTIHSTAANGDMAYSNRGTIFFRIAWGKITYCEVHQDTQKIAAFDAYLMHREPAAADLDSCITRKLA
jgi:hypothetical protein